MAKNSQAPDSGPLEASNEPQQSTLPASDWTPNDNELSVGDGQIDSCKSTDSIATTQIESCNAVELDGETCRRVCRACGVDLA